MNEEKFGTGALERPEDEQLLADDLPWHDEIAGASEEVVWQEKKLTDFLTYPKRNQGVTSSCTCYAMSKQLSIDELSENNAWRELSPRSIYPLVVEPGGGAYSSKVGEIACKSGITLESLLASDGKTEEEMIQAKDYVADAKLVAQIYRPAGVINCDSDFETIASIIQKYRKQGLRKGVAVTVAGENNGTWRSNFPVKPTSKNGLWYHRIVVTDFGLINGKKFLSFDNSWGLDIGYYGQQFLSEEYAPFIFAAAYTENKPDKDLANLGITPPKYHWTQPLMLGSSGPDVLALQQALQSLGMFPISKVQAPTGKFYGITKNGVIMFQTAFGLPQTGRVDDEATINKLNEIFA